MGVNEAGLIITIVLAFIYDSVRNLFQVGIFLFKLFFFYFFSIHFSYHACVILNDDFTIKLYDSVVTRFLWESKRKKRREKMLPCEITSSNYEFLYQNISTRIFTKINFLNRSPKLECSIIPKHSHILHLKFPRVTVNVQMPSDLSTTRQLTSTAV